MTDKMLNQLLYYQQHFALYLHHKQILTLEILVSLLQAHKQVSLKLAAYLPLPILYESRRRHLQRFLSLQNLSIPLLWFPLIKYFVNNHFQKGSRILVIIDGTKWQDNNLLMVSVRYQKRAIPVYWKFLKKGSSNLVEQIAVLHPVIKLFQDYQIVVIGDREFRGVELADWLKSQQVKFALRVQDNTYVKLKGHGEQTISSLGLQPGIKRFYSEVYTKRKGFGQFNLAAYWKRCSAVLGRQRGLGGPSQG
ncbi:hypothetical protein BJP34_05990 [Moorena producens PAL-8-15-08-1]|uniref:Transposase IS4-like domain-containing protein n=1 Tax=Moorena producens PAL-8-15-08-1 TaxID=1458985 RepID=A0A1D8TNS6_9CYAN|nr:transposase [Moorena producens]AOW99055.1 hypothetical protein BJP34_05990 [Moorena producens PAL-8-15-08-1]